MKKIYISLLTIACLISARLGATTVDRETARTVAVNYFNLKATAAHNSPTATLKYTRTENNGSVDFYVFDISPKGFVVVTADDNLEPIIAFSTESNFNPHGERVGVTYWMNQAAAKIVYAKSEGTMADGRISGLWTAYKNGQDPGIAKATTVGPLTTSTWDQENDLSTPPPYIYNLFCPWNATDNERCVTGCVATAMSQIMYYWKYPATGAGSYSYSWDNTTSGDSYNYGTLSANFGATTYPWAVMPNALTDNTTGAQDSAVDLLSYQAGVSVAMEYGDDKQGGSGAWVLQNDAGSGQPCAQNSYVQYFGYNPGTIKGVYASSYSSSAWASLLEGELNAGRVIEYAGWESNGGGHTWVCDGYETSPSTMFHMNWGWQGIDNGWYAIGALNPSPYKFNVDDEALIGIEPNNTSSCGTPAGLTAGSITASSASLSWTAVTGATSYSLEWKVSSATSWTTVTGLTSASYPLSGLSSCTSYLFAVLTTCSSSSSPYSSSVAFSTTGCTVPAYCTSTATNTSKEYIKTVKLGSINHSTSSGGAGYINDTTISTSLSAGSTYTITLTPGFTGSSRNEYFTVYIDYNQNGVFTNTGETVVEVSGRAAVSKSFKVPTTANNGPTRMRVQMQYNSYETNSCATFTYGQVQDYTVNISGGTGELSPGDANAETTTDNDVAEQLTMIKLYPNPALDNINIEFSAAAQGSGKIAVYNISGQKVSNSETAVNPGANTINLSTGMLASGSYILEIESNGCVKRERFVVSR